MFFSSDTSNGQMREEKINAMAFLSEMAKRGKREPEHVFRSFPIRKWECNKSALEETV